MPKKSSNEKSIFATLTDMTGSDKKAYYLMWRYCKHLIPPDNNGEKPDTFIDLKGKYQALQSKTYTEEYCEQWLYEEQVQTAVKWLLSRLHQKKMIELYEHWEQEARKDKNGFDVFMKISQEFKGTKNDVGAYEEALHGISLDDEDD